MINIYSKKCLQKDCEVTPKFNYDGKKNGIYCYQHQLENMVNVLSKKCLEKDCRMNPIFNYEGKTIGIYCSQHKLKNMIDVCHKKCKECNTTSTSNNKYRGYCLRCFIYKFPNEKISRNYKVKEIHMTDFLKEIFKDQVMIFDKIAGGCSRRRPDVYIDKFTHVLIIECDENQHRDTSCENMRTMELFQDFGNRPVVFIRFNPDEYILDGKKITSCWWLNGHGIMVIKKSKQKEWGERIKILNEQIDYWTKNPSEKTVEIVELFY
jgi:hypothetical protein